MIKTQQKWFPHYGRNINLGNFIRCKTGVCVCVCCTVDDTRLLYSSNSERQNSRHFIYEVDIGIESECRTEAIWIGIDSITIIR